MIKFGQKITATTTMYVLSWLADSYEIFIDMLNNIYILGY